MLSTPLPAHLQALCASIEQYCARRGDALGGAVRESSAAPSVGGGGTSLGTAHGVGGDGTSVSTAHSVGADEGSGRTDAERVAAAAVADAADVADAEAHAEWYAQGEALVWKRALINRLELDFARDAARFAAASVGRLEDNPLEWMRDECRMTTYAASTAITIGEQAERLRASSAALVNGRIGIAHLALMARTAEALELSPSATSPFDETRLLGQAERLSVQRFRTVCQHVRHAADREAFLTEQVQGQEERMLRLIGRGDALEITGLFDAEAAALIRTALDPLARPSGAGDDRSRERRYGDALAELCGHALDTVAIPQRASQRTHLQVTSTLETLLGLVGAPGAEMEHGGVIAAATVRRFACDATITRVLVNAESAVIDVGRAQRVVPGATRRALNVRDRHCRWPRCERSASWTHAHHVHHWTDGGRTDLDNLVLICFLCRHRHKRHYADLLIMPTGLGLAA